MKLDQILFLFFGFVSQIILSKGDAEDICNVDKVHGPRQLRGIGKRSDVICYYEGRVAISVINPCFCTHMVISGIHLDTDNYLVIDKQTEKNLIGFREKNPNLRMIISLGSKIESFRIRSLIVDKIGLKNLTSSINRGYRLGLFQGIEIDWKWPAQTGDKLDRLKLIRYTKQIKIGVGEKFSSQRRPNSRLQNQWKLLHKKDSNTSFEIMNHERYNRFYFDEAGSHIEEIRNDSHRNRLRRNSEQIKNIEQIKSGPENGTSILGQSNEVIGSHQTKEKSADTFSILLRLPSNPELLIKAYDFKLLNKFVDLYIMSSHNFTSPIKNVTFHHSRLMGVSDIENADSFIDVLLAYGADRSKIVLSVSAMGHVFSLLDSQNNLPGSNAQFEDKTKLITYQQLCNMFNHGKWTLEREEDLTAPYAYNSSQWIAFDDATSLKIKTKYSVLRNLAGIALFSVDADIMSKSQNNDCKRPSLLKSIYSTLFKSERRTRSVLLDSLENDLVAAASATFSNHQNSVITKANTFNVSPYRIVSMVDRQGRVSGIRQNSQTILQCTRQGYYKHPEDCSRFYRCVKFNQRENDYTIFEYDCPVGLVFDDRWEVCVWPSQANACQGSSEILPIPQAQYECPGEGYFVDPENCRWFFSCRNHNLPDGSLTHYEFRCPFGLAFDESKLICNWPWLVEACGGSGQRPRGGKRPSQQPISSVQSLENRNRLKKGHKKIQNGSDRFISLNPAREPFMHRPTPSYTTPSNVNGCEDCESPKLTVVGHGTIHEGKHRIEIKARNKQSNTNDRRQYEKSSPNIAVVLTGEHGLRTKTASTYKPESEFGYINQYPSRHREHESFNPLHTTNTDTEINRKYASSYTTTASSIKSIPQSTQSPNYSQRPNTFQHSTPFSIKSAGLIHSATPNIYAPTTHRSSPNSITPQHVTSTKMKYKQEVSTVAIKSFNEDATMGYIYPVPSNPLTFPPRKPLINPILSTVKPSLIRHSSPTYVQSNIFEENDFYDNFSPPSIRYGGFEPYSAQSPPLTSPNSDVSNLSPWLQHKNPVNPPKIQYGFIPRSNSPKNPNIHPSTVKTLYQHPTTAHTTTSYQDTTHTSKTFVFHDATQKTPVSTLYQGPTSTQDISYQRTTLRPQNFGVTHSSLKVRGNNQVYQNKPQKSHAFGRNGQPTQKSDNVRYQQPLNTPYQYSTLIPHDLFSITSSSSLPRKYHASTSKIPNISSNEIASVFSPGFTSASLSNGPHSVQLEEKDNYFQTQYTKQAQKATQYKTSTLAPNFRHQARIPKVSPVKNTAVSRPEKKKNSALLNKFSPSAAEGSSWKKFGPGGYRSFEDSLGAEVCQRTGLFRHPTECGKFYECYWDKWLNRFTLHIFPCPVVLGYDSGITACNWPFDGPQCNANQDNNGGGRLLP